MLHGTQIFLAPFLSRRCYDFIFSNRGLKFLRVSKPRFPYAPTCSWRLRLNPFLPWIVQQQAWMCKQEGNPLLCLCVFIIYGYGINHSGTGRLGNTVITYFTHKILTWEGLCRANQPLTPLHQESCRTCVTTIPHMACWQLEALRGPMSGSLLSLEPMAGSPMSFHSGLASSASQLLLGTMINSKKKYPKR